MITLDPDPNWAKILDPDPNSIYLDPQHCWWYPCQIPSLHIVKESCIYSILYTCTASSTVSNMGEKMKTSLASSLFLPDIKLRGSWRNLSYLTFKRLRWTMSTYTYAVHCEKSNPNFRDTTWNVEENSTVLKSRTFFAVNPWVLRRHCDRLRKFITFLFVINFGCFCLL